MRPLFKVRVTWGPTENLLICKGCGQPAPQEVDIVRGVRHSFSANGHIDHGGGCGWFPAEDLVRGPYPRSGCHTLYGYHKRRVFIEGATPNKS